MKKSIFWGVLPVLTGVFGFSAFSAGAQQVPVDTTSEQVADAIANNSGEYAEVNLDYVVPLGMQQKAWNNPLAHMGSGQSKPGYSKYNWTPDTVLPIRLREGMMTLINLPAWELIEKVHIGAPESFNGEVASPNSLLLYADPSYLGVDGNMIIFGRSGNRYVFYLRSETFNTDKITQSVVDVLVGPRWTPVADGGFMKDGSGASSMASMPLTMPGSALSKTGGLVGGSSVASNLAEEWKSSVPMDPESLKFDLDMFLPDPDAVDIAPDNIWRDNIFTYIDLGPKALTMTQRPVVSLLVQDTEVPVGFRTRGPNSRLIVVEAIGDLVLRNGKKVVCIKLRRDPAAGLEYTDYSGFNEQPYAYHQSGAQMTGEPNPEVTLYGGSLLHGGNPYAPAQNVGGAQMNLAYATETGGLNPYAGVNNPYCTGQACPQAQMPVVGVQSVGAVPVFSETVTVAEPVVQNPVVMPASIKETIALEFGTAAEIAELEALWNRIYSKNTDLLKGYEPYYSVDTAVNGEMVDLFRLRVGEVKDAETADALCRKMGRRGYSCSVVRIK